MNIILYKSTTCPQCKVVKMKLDRKGLAYEERLTDNMTPAELAAADIRGIPTMFVDGEKMTNQREMCKWIDAQEVTNG
jgi:glutaredoxin